MNYVYKQKTSYLLLTKRIITSIVILFLLFELSSCYLHKVNSEITIKVTKVGSIVPLSSFIFIYPESSNLSLKYKTILSKIAEQLTKFGFNEVKDIKQANYAFVISLDHLAYDKLNKEFNSAQAPMLNYDKIFMLNFNNAILKKDSELFLDVYLIKDESLYLKVMEGYTVKIHKNVSEKNDTTYLNFVMCSVDALFNESTVFNDSSYQEYYYKCY